MSILEWKSVCLSDVVSCFPIHGGKFKQITAELICYCCNEQNLVFCDIKGYVHIFANENLFLKKTLPHNGHEKTKKNLNTRMPLSFPAHIPKIDKCAISKNNFLTLLSQENKTKPIVKIFNITNFKFEKAISNSISQCQLDTFYLARCIKAFDEHNILSLAIGCDKGDLFLHQGLIVPDIVLNFRRYSIGVQTIITIDFLSTNNIFVCTSSEVLSYTLGENCCLQKKIVLDTKNENIAQCCAIKSVADPYFSVARKDAVYCFTTDGRGPCYAIEGEKNFIAWYKHFLVVVALKRYDSSKNFITNLVVLDTQNKLVVLERCFNGITGLLSTGKNCLLLTDTNELFEIQEHNTITKVQVLLSKGLFDVALRFVECEGLDEETVANVFLKYGHNHLLKANFDLAVDSYIKTIGFADPFVVIEKLLDSRLTVYLCRYLEALFKSGNAKTKHIKLLLNCYERLKISSNIEACFQTSTVDNLPQYCLAQQEDEKIQHDVILDISYSALLNIITDDEKCHKFFSNMEESKVITFILDHSHSLSKMYPKKLISILIRLLTANPPLVRFVKPFISALLEHKELCREFLGKIIDFKKELDSSIYNMLLELYLIPSNCNNKIEEFFLKHAKGINTTHALLHFNFYSNCPNLDFFNQILPRKYNYNWNCVSHSFLDSRLNKKLTNGTQYSLEEIMHLSKSRLQTTCCVVKNEKITSCQISQMFKAGFLNDKNLKLKNHSVVSQYVDDIRFYNNTLTNYLTSSIEFRCNTCDICRQELYLPAVFYLCQHVFHKDCLNSYTLTELCAICAKSPHKEFNNDNFSSDMLPSFTLQSISKIFVEYSLTNLHFSRSYTKLLNEKSPSIIPIPLETSQRNSTNPFDSISSNTGNNPFENISDYSENNPFE